MMEGWMDLIRKGVAAVSGLLAFVASIYGGWVMLCFAMKAPDAFAIVAAAAIIGAAVYFRGPTRVYNLQMGHPETESILAAVADLMQRQAKRDLR